MTKLFAIGLILLAAMPLAGQLTVQESKEAITVVSSQPPTWKAIIDKALGGVIGGFHVPADGPDVLSDKAGLFHLFVMADKPAAGQTAPQRCWMRRTGTIDSLRLSSDAARAVVEVGGRMLTPAGELVANYSHKYTLLPDRIALEGSTEWKFKPGTRLNDSSMVFTFRPGAVAHPVRVTALGKPLTELPIGPGGGAFFPEGMDYPIDAEVWFTHGPGITVRALRVPAPFAADRRYVYERPWQTGFHTVLAFEGEYQPVRPSGKGNSTVPFPAGPVDYRYEVVVRDAARAPFSVSITDPPRDVKAYGVGQVVNFKARTAGNAAGNVSLEWEVLPNAGPNRLQVLTKASGASMAFKIPADAPHQQDFANYVVKVTATDSAGHKAYDYCGLAVVPPYPPSPVIQRLTWDARSLVTLAGTPGHLGLLASTADGRVFGSWSEYKRDCAPAGGDTWVAVDRRWAARPENGPDCAPASDQPRKAIAQVAGAPPRALNVAPLSAQLRGEVKGMVAVNGVLYAWVVTETGLPPKVQLAWSDNGGESWRLSDWSFPDKGSIFYPLVFVDAGRDSARSPDGFVYMFGATWPKGTDPCFSCRNAYLARVPKDRVKDRGAYQFFQYVGGDDKPRWTSDGTKLFQLLSAPEGIDVTAATYHQQLKRYLAVVRAAGRITVLDAEQPWGPWYTVPADELPAAPTQARRSPGSAPAVLSLPSKWISEDGKVVWAVFSRGGYRSSEMVRGQLILRAASPAAAKTAK